MPYWQGVRYLPDGGSPLIYMDKDGNDAPPEAVRHFVRREMERASIKPAGRRKMTAGESVDERRLAMLDGGLSMEQIAESEGHDLDVIRRSINRAMQKQRAGQ